MHGYRMGHGGLLRNKSSLGFPRMATGIKCFVPHGSLVAGDVMLAQKIALETFEAGALSVARRFVPNTRLGY
jgi:hypothetical protein